MATKAKKNSINVDLSGLTRRVSAQFQGLDFRRHPSTFPVIPRYALLLVVTVGVLVAALGVFWLNGLNDELSAARDQEAKLRQDYITKLRQAVILNILRNQKKEVMQYVDSLEKQLPGKSEIDALLSDINQAGLERNLQFELFKPGNVILKEYYAELPISIKITGRYHDIGAFAADVANFSRIVTLSELSLVPADKKHPDQLTLNATARTFRYLDPDEIEAQRKVKTKGSKK
jgi:type IV pilus assembly protein PilO